MQSVILIIDKRRELSVKYKKLLGSKLAKVLVSKSFLAAMKLIQENEPDLIIISDSIEGGLQDCCKKIRALTYNMRPVIVTLSKSAELQDRLTALESGADDFLSEPVNNEEFVMRMMAHLRREFESNLDDKKLLPNKNYSIRAIKRALNSKDLWGCLLISIENFRNYRETYTELASDKLVRTFCAIIQSTLSEDDYLGEISENEFLIITNAFKAEKIANFLTFAFDSVAKKFYSSQDLKRGYMIMHGDEVAGMRSGFVRTSIGVVTNEFNKYEDTSSVFSSLVNMKNLANLPDRSNYLIERAKISTKNFIQKNKFNNKIFVHEPDEAMRVLLKTILELQGYEISIIENFKKIKKSDSLPAIIIIDAGNAENLKGLETIKLLREKPEYSNTKIIVTSIFHDKELILNYGADLYLPKPYELPQLIKWVKNFMDEVNF